MAERRAGFSRMVVWKAEFSLDGGKGSWVQPGWWLGELDSGCMVIRRAGFSLDGGKESWIQFGW